jgi:ubiquitin carboxyl-terminal hydrolase 4/11/15
VFCLQRFKSANIYYKDKLEDLIDYPIEGLDMSKYVVSEELKEQSDLIYDLYAVSNHYGTLNFGHYTAIAKNHINGKWYDYNDSSVSEVRDDEIVSKAAYVLYYKRRHFFPEGKVDFNAIRISPENTEPVALY